MSAIDSDRTHDEASRSWGHRNVASDRHSPKKKGEHDMNQHRDRGSLGISRNRGAMNALLLSCALCLLVSSPLRAQDADVSGAVRDTSGSVIPNAALKLMNQATGVSRATQSNESGLYSFPHIQAGVYDISVSAQGFQSQNRVGITINVADHSQIDFELKVGDVKESVTVTAGQELINTADSVTGQTVDRTFINDLPLLSRSALDLAFLAPGITQPTSFAFGQTGQTVLRYITSNNFVSN